MNKIKKFGNMLWNNRFYVLAFIFLTVGCVSLLTAGNWLDAIVMFNGVFACLVLDYIKTRADYIETLVLSKQSKEQ